MTESDPHRDSLTEAGAMFDARSMADEGLIERDTVNYLRLDLWASLQEYYLRFREDEKTPLSSTRNYELAQRWRMSGIEPIHPTLPTLGAVAVDSLVNSVRTGAIRMITGGRESLAEALRDFLSARTAQDLTLGEFDETPLVAEMIDVGRRHDGLEEMIAEASQAEYGGRYVSGPYRKLFARVNDRYMGKLREIHPKLTNDAFHTDNYRSQETISIMRTLSNPSDLGVLATNRMDSLAKVTQLTQKRDAVQTLPAGLLESTEISGQRDDQACSTAVFRMIHHGLTGHFVGEYETMEYLREHFSSRLAYDVDYLKIFETAKFENEYGKSVSNIVFGGMSIGALANYVRNLHDKQSKASIYSVASLRTVSEHNSSLRAQHRVVLLDADEASVNVIDSKFKDRVSMPKDKFLNRWAATQNSGYIVVSQDS